jgi:hypothetical protein
MELLPIIRNIFPFDKNPKFTISGNIDKPSELRVTCIGSVKQVMQWARICGLKHPLDFVRPTNFSDNKIAKELQIYSISAESWGWTAMNIEFNGEQCTLTMTSMFFDMQYLLELLTKQGHVIAGLYLDGEIGRLILDEEP